MLEKKTESRPLPALKLAIQILALGLWFGGLNAIGALVAPTAFHVIRNSPFVSGDAGIRSVLAGQIIGNSLHLFNIPCYASGFILLLAAFIPPRSTSRPLFFTEFYLCLALLLSAWYLGRILFPELDRVQALGDMAAFDRLHHLYENISMAQLPVLVVLSFVISLRALQRRSSLD